MLMGEAWILLFIAVIIVTSLESEFPFLLWNIAFENMVFLKWKMTPVTSLAFHQHQKWISWTVG